jgi:hypothetical protein
MLSSCNHLLHTTVVTHFHDIISRFPPPHAPGFMPSTDAPYRIGEYLVSLGYLLPHELAAVLHTWQHEPAQPATPLGCHLVAHNLVPAPVIATVLLLEWLDRWEHNPSFPPRSLDEQLLIDGILTADQVALVVAEQMLEYEQGAWITLDSLIARHGWRGHSVHVTLVEEQDD